MSCHMFASNLIEAETAAIGYWCIVMHQEYERRFPSKNDDRHFSKKSVRGHVGAPAYSLQQLCSFMNLFLGIWHLELIVDWLIRSADLSARSDQIGVLPCCIAVLQLQL